MYKKLVLKKGKEKSLLNFHPWVFSGAVASNISEIADGEVVEIFSSDKKYLATAHFSNGSIMGRIISFEQGEINYEFWKEKFTGAFALRQRLGFIDNKLTNAFRLINAEGDGMPGLIIDVYDRTAVIQAHTIAMHNQVETFAKILSEIFGNNFSDRIFAKVSTWLCMAMVCAWITAVRSYTSIINPGIPSPSALISRKALVNLLSMNPNRCRSAKAPVNFSFQNS